MNPFALEAGAAGGSTSWFSIIILVVLALFVFFMFRSQRKEEKKNAEMRDNLAVGDEITTIGGIIGEIVSIKGETITVETSKAGTKIRFLRSAVRSVDVSAAEKAAPLPEKTEEPKKEDK